MLEEPPAATQQLTDWRQALRMIRANSSLLKTAQSQVDLARGQSRQALAPALPSLTGDGQVTRHLLKGTGVNLFATPPREETSPTPQRPGTLV
jgi:outer membrane protein TolC